MMHWIDYLVILAYLVGTLYLGFIFHRKASENIDAYFLGDRQIPWWALGASGMASNVDIAGTMIMAALVFTMGTKGFFIEIRGGLVLVLAFFMVFMGKWTRRAQVMTTAEWMRLRFGTGREGNLARVMSAVANIVIHVWIISYFAVGGGKFFSIFLGVNDQVASIIMIVLTMIYATASGFYGVVWTDVFQGGLILIGVLYVVYLAMAQVALPESFPVSFPMGKGEFQSVMVNFKEWSQISFPSQMDLPGQYSMYNLFSVTIAFYFIKTCIEGFGGAGGYMGQRYFAAKSDREAGLLSLFWILLLSFRWPLITSIAVLAVNYSLTQTPITDPEMSLPIVIQHYAPIGMKGLLVACFMAAAMSTFVSIINSSAAYWVKDIYHAYLNPKANEKQLLHHSRGASILIVVVGLLFSFPVVNINDIWGWLTMAFGAGLFVPLLLRWYWWRYNGYGFATGTFFGMVAAIATHFSGLKIPEYMNFLVPGGISLLGCLIGTYLTAPTDEKVLRDFFETTRPFGFWGPVRKHLPLDVRASVQSENRRDLLATFFAVPWMIVMCLMGMVFVMKRWDQFLALTAVFAALSVGLYWSWFRHLSGEGKKAQDPAVKPAVAPVLGSEPV